MLSVTSLPARAFRVLHHSFPVLLSGLALCMVAPGCGSDDTNSDSDAGDNGSGGSNTSGTNNGSTGNTNGSGTGGNGGADAVVGTFSIRLVAPSDANGTEVPGHTSITGKVYDGPSPDRVEWTKDMEEAGCVLLKPSTPFCDPACVGTVCVAGGKCLADPTPQNVGDVKLEGLTSAVTLANVGNAYSTPSGVNLPYPAFAEGAELKLSAAGGAYSAFSITVKGVAPLTVKADKLAIEAGAPLSFTWEPSTMAGLSRIHVALDISHHGGTKGKIECDVEDTGSLSIPAAMVSKLTSLGVAGFPAIEIHRSNTATTSIAPGKVQLNVYADVKLPVDVPGVVSCSDDTQCPTGQTCQDDLTCK